jgi:hypothetical protein
VAYQQALQRVMAAPRGTWTLFQLVSPDTLRFINKYPAHGLPSWRREGAMPYSGDNRSLTPKMGTFLPGCAQDRSVRGDAVVHAVMSELFVPRMSQLRFLCRSSVWPFGWCLAFPRLAKSRMQPLPHLSNPRPVPTKIQQTQVSMCRLYFKRTERGLRRDFPPLRARCGTNSRPRLHASQHGD